MKKIIALAVVLVLTLGVFSACAVQNKIDDVKIKDETKTMEKGEGSMMEVDKNNLSEIWLAGGCFWGVEEYFSRIDGVNDVVSGYANGNTEMPSYQEVIRGSGHAETVYVQYDPKVIDLQTLLTYYFRIINPTILNQQGNDIGIQYRTGIYYKDKHDLSVIDKMMEHEQTKFDKSIVVEVLPLEGFYEAEDYHQDYLVKNPNGYCHVDFRHLDDPIEDIPDSE
jgi:peptide methionine sulfoxide reductase msrA/msrB